MVKIIIRYICVMLLAFFMTSIIMTASLILGLLIKCYCVDGSICLFDAIIISSTVILACCAFPPWFLKVRVLIGCIESAFGDSRTAFPLRFGLAKIPDVLIGCNYLVALAFIYFNVFYCSSLPCYIVSFFGSKLFGAIHMAMVSFVSVLALFLEKSCFCLDKCNVDASASHLSADIKTIQRKISLARWNHNVFLAVVILLFAVASMLGQILR